MDVYEQVSEHPLYIELNRRLVDGAGPLDGARVLDLGCGTGSITELVLARAADAAVWAVDPDAAMCEAVRRRVGHRVACFQADAGGFGALLPPGALDVAFAANCVHLFPDVDQAFAALARVLRPGGRLLFNTAFHDDAARPDERKLYVELVLRARRIAQRLAPQAGPAPRAERPLAKRSLNADGYRASLAEAGFAHADVDEVEVELDADLVLDIVAAPMFATGALPGTDPDVAVQAVTAAVKDVFAGGATTVHRRWLYLSATR
jgi:ubiquinone/menaquinone biosynthesis C-methylase UbiE